MKISKELSNGALIFGGVALYFFLMELLGLSNIYYLRTLNVLIVFYGINRTFKQNISEKKIGFLSNLISGGLTGALGIFMSFFGLLFYIYLRGGESYLNTLSSEFFLTGGKGSINEYCFGILFEGLASVVIVVLITMLLWSDKTSTND